MSNTLARRGRPPARALTDLEREHLLFLVEVRGYAHGYGRVFDERLEDFVLKCRENGASTRGIAETLGVAASTVQTWTENARRRRGDQSS